MVVAGRHTRRRRPSGPFVAVVLTLVVLVTTVASRALSGDADERLAYLDDVRPAIERSTQQGLELNAIRTDVLELGRAGLARRLDRLSQGSEDVLEEVAGKEPPDSLRAAHGLLVASLAVRARGAASARTAFTEALGDGRPDEVAVTLAQVGVDLQLADRNYELFVASVPRDESAALPQSKWVTETALWDRGELGALVSTLRSNASLAPVHDVAVVTVIVDPAAVGREGEALLLPAQRAMRVEVVVANVGNAEEEEVVVSARVGPAANAGVDSRTVELAPGQRRTVVLGSSERLRPVPNQASTLTITVGPVAGEEELAGNEWSMQFLMRS
jgi:hypothetical protein